MFALVVGAVTLVFVGLSSTGALVESISPDELNRMGIVRRS